MSTDEVTLDLTDGVATVTLDRPDKMNALSPGIVDGVDRALAEITDRDEARCVVLRGAGNAFCAGGDIGGMAEREDVGGPERAAGVIDSAERVALNLFEFDLPTVAAVDGYCLGAGMGVALATDVVLASEEATFSLAFRNVGLTLDYATSYFVPRAVGPYRAKELALTGERFSGERAAEMGLVNHAYPAATFDEKVDAFVEQVATGPTRALALSVRNIDRGEGKPVREVIEAEAEAQALAAQTDDHREGVAAFSESREPRFEGR